MTVPSQGHDEGAYTSGGNMVDSLLWSYIRYAAKDWCVSGSGEPGCDAPVAVRAREALRGKLFLPGNGVVSVSLPSAGRYTVIISEAGGRIVAAKSAQGPGKLAVPGLRRGLYLVGIGGEGPAEIRRLMVL